MEGHSGLRSAMPRQKTEISICQYNDFLRPRFEYCVHAWKPFSREDESLKKVQRLATRMTKGQGQKTYEQRLMNPGLCSPAHRSTQRPKGDSQDSARTDWDQSSDNDTLTEGKGKKLKNFLFWPMTTAYFPSKRLAERWN